MQGDNQRRVCNELKNKQERVTYIGIKLTDEAGEIAVLEVRREEKASEFGIVPNDEAAVVRAPGDDLVGG